MKQRVYFFKPCGLDGPIKIGCSECPQARLETFAAWSPFPLELIGSVPGTMQDELYLHRCFYPLRSHGEWFRSSPELRAAIDRVIKLDHVPRDIVDPADIVAPVRRVRSEEHRQLMSYRMRCDWATRKLRTDDGYYRHPKEVEDILDRWSGHPRIGRKQRPSDAEIALLEAFLVDPKASAVFHPNFHREVA